MRFAWHRESEGGAPAAGGPTPVVSGIRMAYNIAWWVPILLTFVGIIDYDTGFVVFAVVTAVRLLANLIANNVLTPEQAEAYPFRM